MRVSFAASYSTLAIHYSKFTGRSNLTLRTKLNISSARTIFHIQLAYSIGNRSAVPMAYLSCSFRHDHEDGSEVARRTVAARLSELGTIILFQS
jgi:hypothetical protein